MKFILVLFNSIKQIILLSSLITAQFVWAATETLVVDGSGIIVNDNYQAARDEALRAALRDAALRNGLRLQSTSSLDEKGRLSETTQLSGTTPLSRIEVIDEHRDGNTVRVTARVTVHPDQSSCRSNKLIPRIITQAFNLENYNDPGLLAVANHLPQRLLAKLSHSFLVEDYGKRSELGDSRLYSGYQSIVGERSGLLAVAKEARSQFVINGVIERLRIVAEKPGAVFGPLWPDKATGELTLNLVVYDGITGELIRRYRYNQESLVANITRRSPDDIISLFSPLLDQIVEQAHQDLRVDLACIPLTTRIVSVDQTGIYIDAGRRAGLHVGDTLLIYGRDYHLTQEGEQFEKLEAKGEFSLETISSDSAKGRIIDKEKLKMPVLVGDVARIW